MSSVGGTEASFSNRCYRNMIQITLMGIPPLDTDTMKRSDYSRTNRTAGHPAGPNPVVSMRATLVAVGLTVAVVLTIVAPTAMVAAGLTVGLGTLAVTRVRPALAGAGIPLPGTNTRIQVSSTRGCECEDPRYGIAVSLVEK